MDVIAKFKNTKAFVNGKWIGAKSGKTYNVTNPANAEVITSVPDMNADDTKAAIEVAHKAFESWKNVPPKDRSVILRKWYDLCLQYQTELATLITLEMGKPLAEARGEIMYSASFLEWFSEESKRIYGDFIPPPVPNRRMLVIKQPMGVAGMITPWNFPNAMLTRKAGAAIAAGCTVVLKPSEDTPLSALALCQLAEEAGLPPGVLNVVTCDRANAAAVGKEMCENPLVSKISFTGSTAVGKILLAQSASTVKSVSLELGGNAPFIVFDSADIDLAVKGYMSAKFRCSGQTCICPNRLLVQEDVYDRFVDALGKAMNSQLIIGDGLKQDVTQGPLINQRAIDKVDGLVKDAVKNGARMIQGGSSNKNFYLPTLLADVKTDMKISNQEIFGPVACAIKKNLPPTEQSIEKLIENLETLCRIGSWRNTFAVNQTFKTEQEAVTIANATKYGLAGYFYTSDIAQGWRVAEKLEYGMVGVNEGMISSVTTAFGGWKESGLGTEGGKYGIEEFLEKKSICFGGISPM